MTDVFVVSDGNNFLTWDDKGAMATGYPQWVALHHARQFTTLAIAEKNADSVWRYEKGKPVYIQRVVLTLGELTTYNAPETDPEWAEYERLKAKFKNK